MLRSSLVFVAPRRVEVLEEALAGPGSGEVLVRTELSAISPGTEMLFYRGQVPEGMAVDGSLAALGGDPVRYPLRYGYACVGWVTALGNGVDPAWLHRRVFAFQPHASHFCTPVDSLIPVPDDLSAEQAVLLPNMETAVNLVMDGQPVIGERAAVVGLGVVGLLTTFLLGQFPLQHLLAVDPLARRRTVAQQVGATSTVDPAQTRQAGADCDLVYELSGNPAALDTAIALTGYAGRIVIGSWYGAKRAAIDLGAAFHRSRIRLLSSQVSTIDPQWSGRWDKARRFATAWSALRRLDPALLISHRLPIAAAAAAYQAIDHSPHDTLQVLLTYPPA